MLKLIVFRATLQRSLGAVDGNRTHIDTSVRVTAAQIGQIWRLAHADYVDRFGMTGWPWWRRG